MADSPIRLDLANKTRNLRHRTIITKMCQYLKEIIGAGTSDSPMIDRADYNRFLNYLDDIDALIDGLPLAGAANKPAKGDRPEIDSPLTRDDFFMLQEPDSVPLMVNAFWEEAAIRVRKAIREMAGAQSALFSNVWHPSDPVRWKTYLAALRYDLELVVGEVEPLDTPSTEPDQQPIIDQEGAQWNPGLMPNR
jgi:hypothetical protein